jgi:phosphoglycerate dehydrogenase-like enzyme
MDIAAPAIQTAVMDGGSTAAGPRRKLAVAVLDDYQGRAHEYADWSSLGRDVEVVFFQERIDPARLAEVLGGFDVLVLMRERTPFPRPVLEALPRLRLVVTTGMRNASLDVAYLTSERGVLVCGTDLSGGSATGGIPSTAEVAWALILAVSKRVPIEDAAIRRGRWQLDLATNLAGATLGLAGLGHLGSAMVAPARAFGMDVIAWSENLTQEHAGSFGVRRVTKDELLRQSDVLSIHLVLSRRTRGLFGSEELALMKPTAVLINTSRGPIVDEQALVEVLSSHTIAAAGLDVYDTEPLPSGHALTKLDNVVLLPHLGYANEAAFRHMYGQAVADIAAFLQGSPVRVVS